MEFLSFLIDAVIFAVFFLGLKNATSIGVVLLMQPKNQDEYASANLVNIVILFILAGYIVFIGHPLSAGYKLIYLVATFVVGSILHSFVLRFTSMFINLEDEESKVPGANFLFSMATYPFVGYWVFRLLSL